MKILILGRYHDQYEQKLLPFIIEQGESLEKIGHQIQYYKIKGNGLFCYFTKQKEILKIIKEFKPDVIHAHYGLSGITAVLQNKVPVVTTFHNGETLSKLVNLFSSLFSLKAKYMIYVAQHIYDKVYFKRKNRYKILPCGISIDESFPIVERMELREKWGMKKDVKYILFGGAFSNTRKNYAFLKQGLETISQAKVEVLEMKNLNRVQINELMNACDLFALPSKSEGSPQALKEAMACNCPIIATDIADIRLLLGNLDGHYICDFSIDSISKKLEQALDFNGRTQGRDRIIELGYTNKQVALSLDIIYKSLMKQ